MLDPVFSADRIEADLDRRRWNRPVNTRPLSVKTCSGAP
jgi:hypothetical protein